MNALMSVIIAAGLPDDQLARRVRSVMDAIASETTEVIVACDAPWADQPSGVRVVVSKSASRGDKLDRASDEARGDVVAFLEDGVQLPRGWQRRALEIMRDPSVGAAGGPHTLASGATAGHRAASLILGSWFGSGPLRYRYRVRGARNVFELPTTNLVVRRSALLAVGGFQSPTPLGDDTRLCYKLRSLLSLRVVYDPVLAVESPAPRLPWQFLSLVFRWGKQRGDLARRLPQVSKPFPYALPAVALVATGMALVAAPFTGLGRLSLAAVVAAYVVAGTWLIRSSAEFHTGLLASASLPATHVAYAVGFLKGYLGRSLAEICLPLPQRRAPRILIFNWRDITHPWAGGAELYMHQIARRWVQAGCDVGWLCQRYRTGKRVELIDGIRIHRVGGRFTLYPFAALAYLFRLRNRYDVVVDCENGIPFFTPFYARKPVTLVVFHLHSEVFRRELPKWLRWFALWLESWLMPRAYAGRSVVTISGSSQADLEARGFSSERITMVVPGVDLPRAPAGVLRSESPLIVCLGRLKAYKSVDVLLHAMPQILRSNSGARLAIVGQGPERPRLERLAWRLGLAGSVRFYGYLEKEARDNLLARAWLAACPSAFEGYGLVCVEANAWGLPVVASNVPGLQDSVSDGVTGILVPHGDARRLAMEINGLLGDPARRASIGDAGRAWAALHDWHRSAESFLRVVSQIVPAGAEAKAEAAPQLRALVG